MVNLTLQWNCWQEAWEEKMMVENQEWDYYVVEIIAHLKTFHSWNEGLGNSCRYKGENI
jgi:hypothetical protein